MDISSIRKIRYIKLGSGSSGTDRICIKQRKNIAYIGYSTEHEPLHTLALSHRWEEFRREYIKREPFGSERARKQRATAATNQVKAFFEADEKTLWITFYGGLLYYGRFSNNEQIQLAEELGGCIRLLTCDWNCTDANGKELKVENLSGELTKVRGFQATVCSLSDKQSSYLITRLSGKVPDYINKIDMAREQMTQAVQEAIKTLQPKDFELLVEIIFSRTWRRIGKSGGSEKFIDIIFEDPLNPDQRIAVQVKSELKPKDIDEYCQDEQIGLYKKLFFVFHTPEIFEITNRIEIPEQAELVDLPTLANLVVDSGLVHWLKEKTS